MNTEVVRAWIIDRGLLTSGSVTVRAFDGGVSCEVFAASDGRGSIVVKHAQPELRVAATWVADPRRVVHEGEVLRTLSSMTPSAVPRLLAIDADRHMIAISHAPAAWSPWDRQLLAGHAETRVASTLGETLGTWHRQSWAAARFQALDDYELFEALRLDPYFGAMAAEHPRYEDPLTEVVARLRDRRLCLVHGDFSPKNVMVGDDGVWVLDFEVAHIGDPQFDLGFLLTHLLLKAINRPEATTDYRRCSVTFTRSYSASAPDAGEVDGPELCRLIGALLLARIYGKSPVNYLDADGRARTVLLAEPLLAGEFSRLSRAWDLLEGMRS